MTDNKKPIRQKTVNAILNSISGANKLYQLTNFLNSLHTKFKLRSFILDGAEVIDEQLDADTTSNIFTEEQLRSFILVQEDLDDFRLELLYQGLNTLIGPLSFFLIRDCKEISYVDEHIYNLILDELDTGIDFLEQTHK